MRKSLFFLLGLFIYANSFAQINSGSPALPFGKNSRYQYGIMPATLPTSGTYGTSTKAAEAYEAWKTAFVRPCTGNQYRVLFDDGSSTVSEGIAYGMLLSVYASDKALFDGLWAYYKANDADKNGIMDWKISGCSGVTGGNGATDAELDVAMALLIASEQWASGSAQYLADAKSMIQKIKNLEMGSDGQTLNGDAWGNTNSCRNPSYFSPAYYTEFAKVDITNATFWNTTAINASNTILTKNRNATSGLVSNWCDNTGTENACGNTGSGAYGYGADACRNPWRMAVDYLWHGANASTAAKDINGKLIAFVNGFENQLKGPLTDRSVSNPSNGSYINGSYTTLGLPTMTSSAAQGSLNKCYTSIAGLSNNDAYFNTTIRCISLFTLTGNFWAPGSTGLVYPPTILTAVTNGAGTEISLTTNKALSTSAVTASSFTLYLNGVAQTDGITSASISGSTITLAIAGTAKPQPGQVVTLSYSGTGGVKSTDNATMDAFTKIDVLNMLEGNETILDDCEDGNELNNVGGIWFSFDDTKDQIAACKKGTISSITPLSSAANPIRMATPGYNSSAYALNASFTLGANYTPYKDGSCASWTNPAYVGIGTWVDDVETNTMDWTGGTGVSFWYKGSATTFQVIIKEVTDFCFHKYDVPACADWTKITVTWGLLAQPKWGKAVDFSAKNVQKLQWQFETGTTGDPGAKGTVWIDDVRIMGMPPVTLTSMKIDVKATSKLTKPLELPKGSTDTLKLEIAPTPTNASYPVVFWSSSDETVATVDYQGNVKAVGYGDAVITARAKMHQSVTATFAVKVPAPTVNPTSITLTPATATIGVGESTTLLPKFGPVGVTETGLTWKSSDEAIAKVSATGEVTGVAIGGPVTITATSTAATSVFGTASITVAEILPTALAVTLTPSTVIKGESSAATVSFTPANTSNKGIVWSTSDSKIATIDQTGAITTVGAGSVTITATSSATSSVVGTAKLTVNPVLPTGITVTLTPSNVAAGATSTASAVITPSTADNKTVTWSSSNTSVATVNETTGAITAKGAGTTIITATSSAVFTVEGTATLTVVVGIDTKALTDAIATAKTDTTGVKIGEGNGQYSQTSYNTIKAAIAAAEATLSTASQQGQLDAAVTTLNSAIDAFVKSVYVVSKLALNDSITVATALKKNAAVGSANGQYTQTSFDTYVAAIAAAQTVYDNASASQATVNAAAATLGDAIKTFKASAIVVTKTALAAKIKEAEAITYTKGDGNGQYPVAAVTAFETAKSAATTVNTNALASQVEVDKAVSDLATAITTFNGAIVVVDYSKLTASITAAQDVYDAASIGNGNGQYTSTDAATLDAAIKTATAVSTNLTATQASVDDAKKVLDAAVATFVPKKISVTFTALSDAISAANILKTAATVGSADGEYTQSVYNNFAAAIKSAEDVQKVDHVTQAVVDQAAIDLNKASELFKTSKNTSAATDFNELITAISSANDVLVGKEVGSEACQYTSAVKKAFTDVISASQTMVDAGTAKQGEVNSQISVLASAKSTFLSSVNPESSKSDLTTSIGTANATYVGKTIGSNPGQYPAADSIALRTAINAAQTVASNKCATVAQIASAKQSVDNAVTAFLASKVKEASKTDLAAAIKTGDEKAATPSSQIGTNPGQYSQDKLSALTTVLTAAKLVYANTSATAAEVSKATLDLNNAITAFVNSQVASVNKATLAENIALAKSFLDSTSTKIGSNPGQYPSAVISALQTKYSAAKSVYESSSSKQDAINSASDALATAYDIAKASRVAPIDKSALLLEITTAQAKVPAASEIGTAVGQYSSTLVSNLKAAIAAAQTISTKVLATEKEIATALANLQAAETSLVPNTNSGSGGGEIPVTVDKADLKVAIAAANSLKLVLVQGTLPTEYNCTTDSITMLNSTLAFAQTKYDLASATQTSVNLATAALVRITNNIKLTLVPSPSKSVLNTLIANVDAALITSPDRHPSDLTEALTEALAAAKVVAANKKATESEISSAVAALSAANNNWKASVVDAKALKDAILAATILKIDISKNIGTVPTTYLKADFDAFVNAIVAAQAAYDDASASQSVIDAAHLALTSAQKSIKPIESANKASLEYKISEANRKLNGAVAGTKPGNYKIAEYDTLVNRLERATVILSNAKATQAQVDKIKSELNKAIVEFENAQIPATDVAEVDGITVTAATVVENALVIRATGGEIVSVKIIGVWGCDAPAISVNASEATINVSDLSSQIYRAQCVLSNGKVETINFVK